MTHPHNTNRRFDAAAEALILLDVADEQSVAELFARFGELGAALNADDGHALLAALDAVRDLTAPDSLRIIERAYTDARAQWVRQQRGDAAAAEQVAEKPAKKPAAKKPKAEKAPAAKQSPASVMPLAGDDELLRDFAVRATEHLDEADEHLLALEADPRDREAIDSVFRAFHTIKGMAGFLALDAISEQCHEAESHLAEARSDENAAVPEHATQDLLDSVDVVRALIAEATGTLSTSFASTEQPGAPGTSGASRATSATNGTVRLEESRLDALLDTIGELVIAESMVSSSARVGVEDQILEAHVVRLDKITRELQQLATSLRMVSLAPTFRRMARLVRDVAAKAGKDVEFVVSGEDNELDKVVVDRISDPLIHALRNAVDHGIETPKQRVAAGKPATGRVELRAYHSGGAIHIEVADDGKGLDTARIVESARERGLIGEDDRLGENEIFDLVFAPGLSTAKEITDVSGRGVGMDVVRRTVDELRGRVELASREGEGTTIGFRLPITLAIIDGMTLRVGDERYILPLLAIERSVRPTAEKLSSVQGRGLMYVDDEGLVPIVRLHDLFTTPGAELDPTQAVVVIVKENGSRAGLLACELLGQQQVVIKPLGDGLPEQAGISGGAVMPDGRVGLILDAAGLVRSANKGGSN